MIIKLKGADFSADNINSLLNSWPITFYGRSLVTGTFSLSVSKGSTYTATFSVADQCTVDSVVVVRGGTTISNGATISGSTISISVPTTAESGPISITFNGSKENGDDPVIPNVISRSLINIDMNSGQNIGTGAGNYNATTFGDGVFANGKFKTSNGTGYATIPIDFISSKTSKFTAFFVFENWVKGSAKYGRFFRFSSDVPNTYLNDPTITDGAYSIRFKLLNNFTTNVVDYINSDILIKESGSDYYYIPVEDGEKLVIAVRCDGEKYSYWKDGILIATTNCTNATPSNCEWGELQIGDQPQQYALSTFECSKIVVWDDSLTDTEMGTLIG